MQNITKVAAELEKQLQLLFQENQALSRRVSRLESRLSQQPERKPVGSIVSIQAEKEKKA